MCSGVLGIGRNGALFVELVIGVKHNVGVAMAEPAPVEAIRIISAAMGRVAYDLKAKLVAIKADRSRHVVDT
jgi:hypothetical protein